MNATQNKIMPKVSIIIPTYNRSELLRFTLESVLAQTYPNIEIIVVDDGSIDDTAAMLKQYANHITYIQQDNQDVAAARNTGIQAASGEYLTFIDDDDLMLPKKIEQQVHVLTARPSIGLVHCGYWYIDKYGNRLETVSFLPAGTLKELVIINQIWSGAPLIRRQWINQVGGFDTTWATSADWDMWLRLARAGCQFTCVHEPLGGYRVLPQSMMSNVAKQEHGSFYTLDRIFADPQLPIDVLAEKAKAYGTTHLWLSWRYYGAGQWEEAQRNLTEALTLLPHLLENPKELLESIYGDALGVRISDPVEFILNILEHLPPIAAGLRSYKTQLLATVRVGLALRNYAFGNLAKAQQELTEAIALNPTLLEHTGDFANLLGHYATKLPVSTPSLFVETVFQNLPPSAQSLARMRSQVLSDVQVSSAFENYYANRRHLVVPQILQALRYQPAWLKNKGVISILLKSLPALLSREQAMS